MYSSTSFFPLLGATAVLACVSLASAFQPGSDYGVYKTTNLYNCTGHDPVSNVTVPNAADTLPQVNHGSGWEQWSLFMHGTFPMILRWTQGDPSSSEPSSSGKFELLIIGVNGTTVNGSKSGQLSYETTPDYNQISIGSNSLTWDSSALWYNATVSIDGYSMELDSYSATNNTFHPNVGFYNGLLDQTGGWYGSVPLVRGHAGGTLNTPDKQSIALDGLSVMRHMFSENPLPEYINKYSGGTAWGYTNGEFYDTHIFYQTEETNGTVHDAAYLGRALPTPGQTGVFSSAWATYAITDDVLYNLTVNPVAQLINATFTGCSDTDNIPYTFNMNTSTLLGEFTDRGGGKTSYYSISGSTTAAFNGASATGILAGIFEEYQVPSKGDD